MNRNIFLKTGWTKAIFAVVMSVAGSLLSLYASSPVRIDAGFPGGNIKVIGMEGDTVKLQNDLRDTEGNWFYWSFRVGGAQGRTLHFHFSDRVIGVRGPAVSSDNQRTWRWLGDKGFPRNNFSYTFQKEEKEVYFGVAMNYTEKDLHRFLAAYKDHPALTVGTLCKSRKGRDVELIRIHEGRKKAKYKVFLSSRHHCCEMMATYALEGIMETALSDSKDGRWLRRHCDFFIVPLVDKDGVEDGDQGKNRRPHDHNRDYAQRIYPEIRAITEQVPAWIEGKPLFFMDMHCPGLRGGDNGDAPVKYPNEYLYFPGIDPEKYPGGFDKRLLRFSRILEKQCSLPYKAAWNLPFGKSWNTADNYKTSNSLNANGLNADGWGATLPGAIFSGTIEVPYANASGAVVDSRSARLLGHDLAHAIRVYLEESK